MSNRFTSMETFFRLPAEIRLEVLCFLSPEELDLLFLLRLLPDPNPHPYITVRHQALVARYARQDLVMTNFPQVGLMAVDDLEYLIGHRILISARSVTFVFHATSDSWDRNMSCLWKRYVHSLERFTQNFNIRILLANKLLLVASSTDNWFRLLFSCSSNVNWFTIKYSMGPEWESPNIPVSFFREDRERSPSNSPKNVQLQLFDPATLIRHMAYSNLCFHCDSLKTIDLSYNNLEDKDLAKIIFPPNLEEINLLNNSLLVLCNNSFGFAQLTKLKVLNLSNNNIMRVKLRTLLGQGPYQVWKLDLSGNILTEYSLIFACNFFDLISELDLSNNLLSELTAFPSSIKSLNLCGNNYGVSSETIREIFPEGLQLLRIALGSGEQSRFQEVAQDFVNARFLSLKELRIGCCRHMVENSGEH